MSLPDSPDDSRAIELVHPAAKLPKRSYPYDAGLDHYLVEDIVLKPYQTITFGLGLKIETKPGQMLTIRSRGSTKMKGVSCTETTCDAGYVGELKGFLTNHTDQIVTFKKGDRAVQLVFIKLAEPAQLVQRPLPAGLRGTKGFGSTGA